MIFIIRKKIDKQFILFMDCEFEFSLYLILRWVGKFFGNWFSFFKHKLVNILWSSLHFILQWGSKFFAYWFSLFEEKLINNLSFSWIVNLTFLYILFSNEAVNFLQSWFSSFKHKLMNILSLSWIVNLTFLYIWFSNEEVDFLDIDFHSSNTNSWTFNFFMGCQFEFISPFILQWESRLFDYWFSFFEHKLVNILTSSLYFILQWGRKFLDIDFHSSNTNWWTFYLFRWLWIWLFSIFHLAMRK